MNKITTIIGLSFADIFFNWIGNYFNKINDDWFFGCHSSLLFNGCSYHNDDL